MSGIMSMVLGAKTAIAAAVDAYFNLVTLLLPGDGTNGAQNNTFLDSSSNNFTITRNGNTTQGTFSPFSQTGWGNFFNGSTDYLLAGNSADYTFGTGDFSISCWIYPTVSATATTGFFGIGGASTGSFQIFTKFPTGGNDTIVINSTNNSTVVTTGVVNVNAWNHIAISRASGTLSVYLNGTRVANTSFSHNLSLADAVIGRTYFNLSQEHFTGYISDFRVVNGSALYSGTSITVPTALSTAVTNTKLLTCQSNRFIDVNTQVTAKTITPNGSVSVQPFSPFAPTAAYSAATNGGSGYFDGAGDWLSMADNAAFTMGTGDFTIEYWTYVPTLADMRSYGQCDSVPNVNTISFFGGINGSSKGYCGVRSGTTEYACTSTANFPRNQWVHHVLVRDGTTLRQYINGVQDGTSSVGTASVNDSSFQLAIGRLGEFNAYNWNGYISSFRITKGGCLYPSGTTFTPPTAPFTTTVSSGTVSLLTNFTNAGITDATAKNDLETVGNAQISTTQSKFGGSSMYFDGTGDQLILPASENFEFGSGNFTVECWVYITGSSGSIINYSNGQTGNSNFCWEIYQVTSSSVAATMIDGSTVYQASSSSFTINAWNHIAAVRNGNTLTIYVNGTAGGTTANVTGISISRRSGVTVKISGYNNATGMITGYIDDLRITKGYARYTSNFTAPTAAFALQ